MQSIFDSAGNFFHNAPDGSVVYAPFGWWGPTFRVTEQDEERISRRWVLITVGGLGAFVLAGIAYRYSAGFLLAAAPVAVAMPLVSGWLLSRGLPRSPWRARMYSRARGERSDGSRPHTRWGSRG